MFLMLLLIGVHGQMFTALKDFCFFTKCILEIVKKDNFQLFLFCFRFGYESPHSVDFLEYLGRCA